MLSSRQRGPCCIRDLVNSFLLATGRKEGEGKRLEDTCLRGSWIVHENDSRFKDEHAIPRLRCDKFYGMLFEISRSCNDRVVKGVENKSSGFSLGMARSKNL